MRLVLEVLKTTGITATAGIGSNLYLCKVAMDIVAKHIEADQNGVRIAKLDELTYRRLLWEHRPLTDFWRVGAGTARKLEAAGLHTMGDIALRAEWDEEWFYRTFGVNAGLLIDHAWGVEPCTIADIKTYKPASSSLGSGQVLQCPYSNEKARLIVREMIEVLALELVEKKLVTDQVMLTVGYDIENLSDPPHCLSWRGNDRPLWQAGAEAGARQRKSGAADRLFPVDDRGDAATLRPYHRPGAADPTGHGDCQPCYTGTGRCPTAGGNAAFSFW